MKSKYSYYYFCDNLKFTRRFKLPNGEFINSSIFIEKIQNEERYFVHVVKKKNCLETIYHGKDKKEAWSRIPKDAVYVGSSDEYICEYLSW